jgi:hypothetical protein
MEAKLPWRGRVIGGLLERISTARRAWHGRFPGAKDQPMEISLLKTGDW